MFTVDVKQQYNNNNNNKNLSKSTTRQAIDNNSDIYFVSVLLHGTVELQWLEHLWDHEI